MGFGCEHATIIESEFPDIEMEESLLLTFPVDEFDVDYNAVAFTWQTDEVYEGLFELATDELFTEIVVNRISNENSIIVEHLIPDQKYFWRVTADFFHKETSSFYTKTLPAEINGQFNMEWDINQWDIYGLDKDTIIADTLDLLVENGIIKFENSRGFRYNFYYLNFEAQRLVYSDPDHTYFPYGIFLYIDEENRAIEIHNSSGGQGSGGSSRTKFNY